MMKTYVDKDLFIKKHMSYLLQDEITNSFFLSLLVRKHTPLLTFFVYEKDSNYIIAVVANEMLILASNTVSKEMVQHFYEAVPFNLYSKIMGHIKLCDCFHQVYRDNTSKSLTILMRQRNYYCDTILEPSSVSELYRLAEEKDIEVLRHWAYDFEKLSGGETPKTTLDKMILRRIHSNTLFVLIVNDVPVSMASRSTVIGKTVTLNYIYTPKNERRKGYARQLVELVTKDILAEGLIATLYTDLDNPISNNVYQKVGFKPITDSIILTKEKD